MAGPTKKQITHLFKMIQDELELIWSANITPDQRQARREHLSTELRRLTSLYHGRSWPRSGS